MTRDEIQSMAREAGVIATKIDGIERFAALVAEREREATLAKSNASWRLMCQKMVEAEREACAKVCEGRIGGAVQSSEWWGGFRSAMQQCAESIRARSTK